MKFLPSFGWLASAVFLTLPTLAASDYTLNLSQGKFPADVSVKNANGLLPDVNGYKQGYTTEGWTVGRSLSGYIAISPTYTRQTDADGNPLPAKASENILTLPTIEVEPGSYLCWEACSLHPDFKESYRIVIHPGNGDSDQTVSFSDERSEWTARSLRIDGDATQVTVSFIATSECRYLLGLRNVKVCKEPKTAVCVASPMPLSFTGSRSERGESFRSFPMPFRLINAGADTQSLPFVLTVNGEDFLPAAQPAAWEAGQEGTVTFMVAAEVDTKCDYSLSLGEGSESTQVSCGSFLCSDFRKKMLIDKGTGMWCNNCPKGSLDLENVLNRFGDDIVAVETHTGEQDVLADESYFAMLGFRAVPHFMLNRIQASKASETDLFESWYFKPVNAGIEISEISTDNDKASVTVTLTPGTRFDNAADNFRIGYVLTGDVYEPLDSRHYFQQNNCNNVSNGQYYYLPSRIPAPLVKFHNVTLSDDSANEPFNGVAGSLPAMMDAGEKYQYSFSLEKPEILKSLDDGRINVYLIDTSTGELINVDSHSVVNYVAAVENITSPEAMPSIGVNADGSIRLQLNPGEDYVLSIFSIDGRTIFSQHGVYNGMTPAMPRISSPAIVRITTARGSAAAKMLTH